MVGIYKITNKINGKSYIGQSIDIKRRWKQHKNSIKTCNYPLYQEMRKYGLENFDFVVIEECLPDDLDKQEIYYINKFNSYRNGYNQTAGGQEQKGFLLQKSLIGEELRYQKITAKHWKIYYYLLNFSKFDAQKTENHRYIYKDSLNITQVCKSLGIKSRSTFYNAMDKLEACNLIRQTPTAYLIYSKEWVEVDKIILMNLLNFSIQRDADIDLLRVFLILKKLLKVAENKKQLCFTQRSLVILLGHGDTDPEAYARVRIYLALLSYWELIELKQHIEYNDKIGRYTVYHLQNIKEKELSPDFETDIESEMQANVMSDELMEKLMFKMPEFFEDD